MRYGIIAEDDSDVDTLKCLINRLGDFYVLPSPSFRQKGYSGWAKMFDSGASQLKLFLKLRCDRIIVCFDADGPSEKAGERKQEIQTKLLNKADVNVPSCALVPVQELESWLLADLNAVKGTVIKSLAANEIPHPENIASPKEHLKRICRHPETGKERYVPTDHNKRVAAKIDVDLVRRKCPSFAVLFDFVTGTAQRRPIADARS